MGRAARLATVLGINLVLVAGLGVAGLAAHSLGVLAEGVDSLGDAAAVAGALLALRLAREDRAGGRPARPRATAVAALVNGTWLLLVSLVVVAEAVRRLVGTAPAVHAVTVIVASGVAAVVMGAGAILLGGDVDEPGGDLDDRDHAAREGDRLNVRAVLLDLVADTAAAAGVAVAGAVILVTGGLTWLDPTVALVISAVVAVHAARLVAQAARVLWRLS